MRGDSHGLLFWEHGHTLRRGVLGGLPYGKDVVIVGRAWQNTTPTPFLNHVFDAMIARIDGRIMQNGASTVRVGIRDRWSAWDVGRLCALRVAACCRWMTRRCFALVLNTASVVKHGGCDGYRSK